MTEPRAYEWYRANRMAQAREANPVLSWDLGSGTLIRLIYDITWMMGPTPPDTWEQEFMLGVWALDGVAPDPLGSGVDPESVLERHHFNAWDETVASTGRTQPTRLHKDMAVRRTIATGDLLWYSAANGIAGMGAHVNVEFQALILRP